MEHQKWSKAWSAVAVLIIAAGAWLRLARFAEGPALWIDELMFGLNIGTRSAGELLGQLDFGQTAPPLFLLATHGVVAVFGMSEWALRVIPLAASLATLPAFLALARYVVPGPMALVPLAMLTFAPSALRYANEARPYSMDVLIAVVLPLLAIRLTAQPTNDRRWWLLGLGGAVSMLASSPAIFAAAAIGAALIATPAIRGSRAGQIRLAVLGVAWVAVFITIYLTILKPAETPALDRFWAGAFPDGHPASLVRSWMPPVLAVFWPDGVERPSLAFGLLALTSAGGLLVLGRRRGLAEPLLLLGPAVAVSAAALLHVYPLRSVRVTLFAVPSLLLMFWAGITALTEKTNVTRRALITALAVLAIGGGSLVEGLRVDRGPVLGENTDRVVPWLLDRLDRGEPVYIFARAIPAWTYYTTNWTSAADRDRVRDYIAAAESIGPNSGNAPARGPRAPGDGWDRIMKDRGRPILIGSPTGDERTIRGSISGIDSGWAENEAARVAASATPCAAVFMSHFRSWEQDRLLVGLRQAGLRLAGALVDEGSAAYRYCRPAEAALSNPAIGVANDRPARGPSAAPGRRAKPEPPGPA